MKEGLYKVQFQTALGAGYGVIYAKAGKMWGGDSSVYYVGTYSLSGDDLTANVDINEHSKVPGMPTVFGIPKASINLRGKVSGDTITTQGTSPQGTSPQAANLRFAATLTFISD